jgi:myo-inositol 2-dehydrogenase/D-chiro-inositol 1-dehydrogenase
VKSIQGGGPPRVTARDGVEAVRIANAVIESARTGRPVKLAEGSR